MTAGAAAGVRRETMLAGDGLRAVAITVVVYHCVQWYGNQLYGGPLAPAFGIVAAHFFKALNTGLFVFFVLSGYLVSRGFARRLVLGGPPVAVGRYAAGRMLRIVPAFWVALTVTLLLEGTAGSGVDGIAATYGFAQIYVVRPVFGLIVQAWTLDVEAAFYLALPLLAWGAARIAGRVSGPERRAALLLLLVLAAAVASALWILRDDPLPWEAVPPHYFVAFAPGIALAIVEPLHPARRLPSWIARALPSLLVAASVALFVVISLAPPLAVGERTVLGSLCAAALVIAAWVRQRERGTASLVLDNRVMHWLGERSYGIYLFHFLVLMQVWRLGFGVERAWLTLAQLTVLTGAVTLLAAELSWRLVEAPALRLKTRLSSRDAREDRVFAEAVA